MPFKNKYWLYVLIILAVSGESHDYGHRYEPKIEVCCHDPDGKWFVFLEFFYRFLMQADSIFTMKPLFAIA